MTVFKMVVVTVRRIAIAGSASSNLHKIMLRVEVLREHLTRVIKLDAVFSYMIRLCSFRSQEQRHHQQQDQCRMISRKGPKPPMLEVALPPAALKWTGKGSDCQDPPCTLVVLY